LKSSSSNWVGIGIFDIAFLFNIYLLVWELYYILYKTRNHLELKNG
jgi:hypothetical protein